MQEIEAKFRLGDPDGMRARLRKLGAAWSGRVLESNSLFDTPDGRLRRADRGLRIRRFREQQPGAGPEWQPGSGLLTFKGPRADDRLKTRSERETAVADADALSAILNDLGFRVVVVYEKRRETWRLGECEVMLDELPALGWYVEIEGPEAAAVDAARAELGLQAEPLVSQTYVELAAQHGESDADGCRRLVFGGRAG